MTALERQLSSALEVQGLRKDRCVPLKVFPVEAQHRGAWVTSALELHGQPLWLVMTWVSFALNSGISLRRNLMTSDCSKSSQSDLLMYVMKSVHLSFQPEKALDERRVLFARVF